MNAASPYDRSSPGVEFGRRVLLDTAQQQVFDDVGYVVVPLLEPGEVAQLRDWYLDRAGDGGPNPPGAYNDTYAEFSVVHSYSEFRRQAYDHICGVLTGPVSGVVDHYRPLVANYVNKPAGSGVVPTHQNWAVVDEATFQSVSVWVALVDCVVENGAMYLLDGSHRNHRGPRGQWSYSAFLDVGEAEVRAHMTPVCVKAGDAVILDDAVLHYSPPNQTDDARLAIQFVMVPEEASAFYHHLVSEAHGTGVIETWAVTPPFFFDFWDDVGDPSHGRLVNTFESPRPRYGREALAALANGDAIPIVRPLGSPSASLPPPGQASVGANDHEGRDQAVVVHADEALGSAFTRRLSALAAATHQLKARAVARLRR